MNGHEDTRRYIYPQFWLLIVCMTAFGAFVAYDLHYVQAMLEADRSRLSILILLVFLGASGHAAWHIFQTSHRIDVFNAVLHDRSVLDGVVPRTAVPAQSMAPSEFASYFVTETIKARAATQSGKADNTNQSNLVLEVYADQLRSPVEIGWFIVDILIRMGLLGTIVGFIMILGTLADGNGVNPENIQTLLISMSGGMGTALYTTLVGLVTATLLGLQYIVLGRCVEQLVAYLVRAGGLDPAPSLAQ